MVSNFSCGGFGGPPPRKFRNMKCSRSDSRHILVDEVYKYTHRCDMEIETGFQGIRAGKYATSSC